MSALGERMAAGASTVARAWVLTRRDGTVMGFTDHDGDLLVEGVTCRAASGMGAGAVEAGTGLAVDNGAVSGALAHDALTAADIRAGRWDRAEVVAYLVDWRDPGTFEATFRGTLGEITEADGRFAAELRGLAEALNAVRGRVYHARCDAVLGDGRCGLDLELAGRRLRGRVTSVGAGGRLIGVEGGADRAEHWFARGVVRFEDGAAAGLEAAVKLDRADDGGRALELWTAPGAVPAVGDAVVVTTGCDKVMETCRDKFANMVNFRGFPHIPGDDWLMAVPSAGRR